MAKRIIEFESLGNTSNYVAKCLKDKTYAKGDVILAHFQTYGRGQRQNTWQSEPGKNICFSYARPFPMLHIDSYFTVSKCVSLAIAEFLSDLGLTHVRIKWPNDILIADRKIGGILIDHISTGDERYFVIGIGLNVNQNRFDGFEATSLNLEMGRAFELLPTLRDLLTYLDKHEELLVNNRHSEIEVNYLNRLFGKDAWISFTDSQRRFKGRILDVAASGEILVRSKNGYAATYRMGEVKINY